LRHACRISGVDTLAIMLFDVLSGVSELKICDKYELDGKIIDHIPSTFSAYNRCKPIYIDMPIWNEDISGIRNFDDLPENAKFYLKKIEELVGVKISVVSVGPDRTQTIELMRVV